MSGALNTRETVAGDTPASLETSRIVKDGEANKPEESEIDFRIGQRSVGHVTA
jgi:hypothetical protein